VVVEDDLGHAFVLHGRSAISVANRLGRVVAADFAEAKAILSDANRRV
jgi:hypothetical protein